MNERITHIGSYRIERELAREEQRIVYQGWQMSLNRPVQICQLTAPAAADTEFVTRWKLAARDLRDPGHPLLPRILDAQFSSEQPYLVESYIVADRLADRLDGQQDLNQSVRIIAGVADALGYAHRRGWSHGHLGPEAVRVIEDGSAYLLDLPWMAAHRPKSDLAAMQADVRGVIGLLDALRAPRAGARPALTGDFAADTMAMVGWLSQGEPADSVGVASALAPVLVQALSGSIVNCYQLAELLQPIAPRAHTVEAFVPPVAATFVTPPPGASPQPQPSAPPPVFQPVSPAPQPPPPMPPPVYPASQRSSGRGPAVIIGAVVLLVALLAAGYLLCQTGVLPFCVTCDEGLIAQYVSGARVYEARESWGDAKRESQAALSECAACGSRTGECVEAQIVLDNVSCHLNVDDLIADGQTLLDNDDACTATAKLEEAIAQSDACKADTSIPISSLARNSDGGAYTLCAQQLLAKADSESASDDRFGLCEEARDLLGKARDLKSASPLIGDLYLKAEGFAALQTSHAAGDWSATEAALRELQSHGIQDSYCGVRLDDFRFDILIGQGMELNAAGDHQSARLMFDQASPLALTLAQKNRLAEAIGVLPVETATPTPTATPEPTATPVATATPFVTSQGANIRACPAIECARTQEATAGTSFASLCYVDQSDGRWYKVKLASGEGWVRDNVITLHGTTGRCNAGQMTPTPSAPTAPPATSRPPSGGACRSLAELPPVTLLSPRASATCNGPVTFSWQAPYTLLPGEAFEIHIWPDRGQNKDNVKRTRDTSIVIDLRKDVRWINWLDDNRAHFWEIVVVCQGNDLIVSQAPRAQLFYFWPYEQVDENNPTVNCHGP